MKKHGFRSIFSLLLALMMVCSMLPTAAFAEGDVEEQSVVEETYTVTYADGMGGAAFQEQKTDGLRYGDPTPAFAGAPALDGYTFTGWDQEIAATVTQSVTYTARWQEVQQEAQSDVQPEADGNVATVREQVGKEILLLASNSSVPLTLRISSYGAPFKNGSTGEHNVNTYTWLKYIRRSDVGSDNASGSAHAYFKGSNESGWQLWLKVEVGNYKYEAAQNAWVYNKDMSAATGDITYGLSFNSSGGTSTYISIKGATDQPQPTPFTFILKFDVNGGTGTFADVTRQSSAQYEMLQIPSTYVPTREGHTFKGWKDTYWDSTYQPGASVNVNRTDAACTVTDTSCTKTLYAVWEKNAPNGPTSGEVTNLLGQVTVHCTTPIAGHEDQTYGLNYILSSMVMAPDGSGYTCDVRVEADEYVTKYNKKDYPGTDHVLADGEKRIRSFVLRNDNDGKGWYISEGENLLPIVFNVKCEAPTPPTIPTDKEIERALSGKVNVVVSCVTENSGHPSERYPLFAYVSGLTKPNPNEVTANSDGTYSYTVSFLASNFVKMYSQAAPIGIGADHELADVQDLRTVTLTLRDSTVGWTATTQNIDVSAKCEEQQPEGPSEITDGDLEALLKGALKIECTAVEGHVKLYDVKKEDVRSKNVSGNNCEITFDATPYFGEFIGEFGQHSSVAGESLTKVITLKWVDGKWVATNAPIIHHVVCVPEIDPPKKPGAEDLAKLEAPVEVVCDTKPETHTAASFALIEGTYDIGEVVSNETDGYTCDIIITADQYVTRYKTDFGPHTLPGDPTKTLTLKFVEGRWIAEEPAIFHVVCEEEVPIDLSMLQVQVRCANSAHAAELYGLSADTTLETIDESTRQVTIQAAPYVDKYNETNPGHKLADLDSKTITITWNGDLMRWDYSATMVTFDVKCKPDAPKAEDLLSVVIHCKSDVHNDGLYDLTNGIFTVGEVEGNEADGYTCKVTVEAAQYVNKYVSEMKVNHDIVGEDTKTVTLKYESAFERWTVDSTVVTFDVECIPAPNISMLQVQVHCVTPNSSHMDEFYDLPEDTTLEYVDANTRKITVQAAPYVERYGNGHELADGESESKTITATWNGVKWDFNATSVTFDVKCETQPEVPGDITDEDLAKLKVVIHCTTNGSHTDRTYDLIAGTYRRDDSNDGGFTCYIAVLAAPYVNEYISDTGTNHELVDPQKSSKTITLRWNTETKAWAADSNSVTFDVTCENVPAQKYTVTYTDGVDGVEIFKDQVYADLTAGTATPKFDGTPTRVGYFFAGWNPAVTATVTGNATYTASWKVDSNNNGKPDDEEERYTVTYLDGANGRAFASQVYPGLLSGTATPKFNGTPVRSGYVFIGWSPVWSGTVTGNVTYTATWSTITGGLDKVPKTGDNGLTLALSALLLFSFCGAAACVVSTKKRG